MSTELLQMLANMKLPFTVVDSAQIDMVRVLDAAGCIKVLIPTAHVDCDNCTRQDPATVIEITPFGRRALNQAVEQNIARTTARRSPRL